MTKQIPLRLPDELAKQIDAARNPETCESRNAAIIRLLKKALEDKSP